jgi:HlyD family secretion protein
VGMTANLEIRTATRESVLLVPNTALQPKGAGRVVLVQNADGTTSEVAVQTGLSDGVQTEVIEGLAEGAVIVTNPNAQEETGGGLFGN